MSWTADDIPDQTGRVAVVTGANGGLGLETARALAAKGAHVVLAARNQTKAQAAVDDIKGTHPDAKLEVVPLDLSNQASVKEAAAAITAAHPKIDLLINNAGIMGIPEQRTADGYEMQFGTNHLGHWTLTALLMPALRAAGAARIVTVSSTAHHMGKTVNADNPHLKGKYGPWKAYGQSKFANFQFGLGLQAKLKAAGSPVTSYVAHPGLTNSDLQTVSVEESDGAPIAKFFHSLSGKTGMTPARGALSQLRAATDPDAKPGTFWGPLFVNNGPPVRKPVLRRQGERGVGTLWTVSERETGVALTP